MEAYYAGNGSSLGWIMLDPEVQEKSADGTDRVIVSFNEAEVEALRNIEGKSLGVDVDIFQGEDAYVVEIDGADFMGTEHQNRQGQWRLQQIFDTTDFTPTVKRFPGPQILGELIVRMGGAGVYSGPGRMVNVAV